MFILRLLNFGANFNLICCCIFELEMQRRNEAAHSVNINENFRASQLETTDMKSSYTVS